ncbi:hypothetical protein [Arthrobacter bambusae]|uniref:hypothetical protein n=1 Tax=Arthrobacter bambusae TaxID=1338426 RepID=UPI002786E890|nr:hypothetical protein [Arthrobacter bambusae]MDQ0030905.1 hypothetical protein [Arthrobacter bambusae]MDQ0099270.1 hypothetical protein [Arthrobacter bambusae]
MTTTIWREQTASGLLDAKYSKTNGQTGTDSTSSGYLDKDWVEDRTFTRIWIGETELQTSGLRRQESHATDQIAIQYADQIESRAQGYNVGDGKDLLQKLAVDYAMAWVDIAKMLGVSVPAIRKWRMNGGVNPENLAKLAHLCAFVDLLSEQGIRPASWLSTPMLVGYTAAPKHLYNESNTSTLLDLAKNGQSARDVLDTLVAGWQEKYDARGYEVARFDDGSYGIISKKE